MNVKFCESCRSLVLADFRYCPYCGSQIPRGPGLEEALTEPFRRLEAASREPALARFAELNEELDRLEADMDLLMSQPETESKHGSS